MSARDATMALIELLGRAPEDFGLQVQLLSNPAETQRKSTSDAKSKQATPANTCYYYEDPSLPSSYSSPCEAQSIPLVELSRDHVAPQQSARDSGYECATDPWDRMWVCCSAICLRTAT